jgi:hypothetical protein
MPVATVASTSALLSDEVLLRSAPKISMRELCPEYQLGKRKMKNAVNFVALPTVTDFHP